MAEGMTVEKMQTTWNAAVQECLTGHEHCSYGGMTAQTGYWLQADDCRLNHGERCAWCGGDADTGFSGWAVAGVSIYRVPSCMSCAQRWVQIDPQWRAPGG